MLLTGKLIRSSILFVLLLAFLTVLAGNQGHSSPPPLPCPPFCPQPPPGGQAPAAPSNLTATTVSQSQINLSWQDNSNNEQGFKIERKTQGGSYSQITSVSANTQNYNDTGLNSGTNYCYRVRAYNANGESAPSNEACATTQGGGTTPPPGPGPSNQLPVAAFTYSPQNPKPGEVITFDCSPSSDPDGSIISCRWDFGGQGTHVSEQGKQHQHKFDREGTYTVKLTVKDNAGAESSTSQTINVRSGTTPGPGPTPPPPSTGMLECLAGSDQFIEDMEMLSIIDAWIKNKSYKNCGAPSDTNVLQALNLWIKSTVKVAMHLVTDRVSDDNAPGTARKQFSPEERTVYSYVKLEGRIGGQKVSWEFIDPQGKVYWSAEATLPADKNIGVAWIQIAGSGAAQLPGRWTVKFYIDGRLQFEDTFEIIKSGSKPSAILPMSLMPLGGWRLEKSK